MATVVCRVCGKPMTLLDDEEQRWYCYKDDEIYWAKENRRDGKPKASPKNSILEIGTFNQGFIRGAGIDLILGSISAGIIAVEEQVRLTNLQNLIYQYSSLYSQTEIFGTQVTVPLANAASERMLWGVGGLMIAVVSLILLLTRKNEYSNGWWTGFGLLNAIGGVADIIIGRTAQNVGSVTMTVGQIVSLVQSDIQRDSVIVVVFLIIGTVLVAHGAKQKIPRPPSKPLSALAAQVAESNQAVVPDATATARLDIGVVTKREAQPKASTKFCRYCGAKILRTSKFCEECGRNIQTV